MSAQSTQKNFIDNLILKKKLNKIFINVCHLNIFLDLTDFFKEYHPYIIPIANHQKENYPDLNYLETINNLINTEIFSFNEKPDDYALMISIIGYHKNQKDAIKACQKANIPLILSGKIRDRDYFDKEMKPFIDGKKLFIMVN